MAEHAAGWRAMASRGFADLSPPEARHAILELPTNRADYVGMLQDMGDYPRRSPIGHRVPSHDEVAALNRAAGRWRAVVLLEDDRALATCTCLFNREFVLDPMYDSGALLYAAWHDPLIRDEHSRRLAEQAGLLVRAGPLLNAATAILAPDHLPGSWNPRPGWRRPRPSDDRRQLAGWAMRSALVLVYWADRLDAVVCTTRQDVIVALDVVLGEHVTTAGLELVETTRCDDAQSARDAAMPRLCDGWAELRRMTRRRSGARVDDIADQLSVLESANGGKPRAWRVALGPSSVPEPALLIRRVLMGEDPERNPPLPRRKLRRRMLCLVPMPFQD